MRQHVGGMFLVRSIGLIIYFHTIFFGTISHGCDNRPYLLISFLSLYVFSPQKNLYCILSKVHLAFLWYALTYPKLLPKTSNIKSISSYTSSVYIKSLIILQGKAYNRQSHQLVYYLSLLYHIFCHISTYITKKEAFLCITIQLNASFPTHISNRNDIRIDQDLLLTISDLYHSFSHCLALIYTDLLYNSLYFYQVLHFQQT